jgi:outer membrane protein assembly factor BamA
MCSWVGLRRALLTLLAIPISPCLLCAQSPECVDHSSTVSPTSHEIKITLVGVEFRGESPLSREVRAQVVDKIRQSKFVASPEDSDKDWVNKLTELTILETLREQGYFTAYTEITPYLVRAESRERFYAISIAIESGPQYHLSEIHIVNSTLFSPTELRKQIQLSLGDVFDVSKIRQGIETISGMYVSKGYIDVAVEPQTNVDESKGIDLVLILDEGKQYRVGTVQILGLSTTAENLLRSLLVPGQVFDSHSLRDFLKKNKSLLPIDYKDINIRRNSNDGTVDIVLDRRCSKGIDTSAAPTARRQF